MVLLLSYMSIEFYLSLFEFWNHCSSFCAILSRNWFLKCSTWPVWEFPLTPFIPPFFNGGGDSLAIMFSKRFHCLNKSQPLLIGSPAQISYTFYPNFINDVIFSIFGSIARVPPPLYFRSLNVKQTALGAPVLFAISCSSRHILCSIFWLSMVLRLLFALLYYSQNVGFRSLPNSHCVQKIALLFPRYNLAQLITVEFIINVPRLLDL